VVSILRDADRTAIHDYFDANLAAPARVHLFREKPSLIVVPGREQVQGSGREVERVLGEVAALSDRVSLEVHDDAPGEGRASEYGVDKVPAIVVTGEKDSGVRFYGFPSGHEFATLIEAIVDVSRGETDLKPEVKERLQGLVDDVHLQVFVTPT
jgi:alkyl hydroperoxide reductase subunit AhpF